MDYFSPGSLREALDIRSQYGEEVTLLAGGTDLLVRMKDGKETPARLLDLAGAGLDYVQCGEDVRIGAMVSLNHIVENPELREKHPILAEAAREVGAVQTRSLATLGGNICTGIPSADMIPALLVLDSQVVLRSRRGERVIRLEDFVAGPRQLRLEEDEILTEVVVPAGNSLRQRGFAFLKVGKRKALRLSIINLAVKLELEPGSDVIRDIAVAMGTVAPVPLRLRQVEEYMTGRELSEGLVAEAIPLVKESISPRTSLRASKEYRLYLAENLFKRGLELARQRAGGGETA